LEENREVRLVGEQVERLCAQTTQAVIDPLHVRPTPPLVVDDDLLVL
jgi:hypothetical protein